MTRDEIVRMAREAGFVDYELEDYTPSGYDIRYERFAALIRADEREACAQILDRNANACANNSMLRDVLEGSAVAIRARSQP